MSVLTLAGAEHLSRLLPMVAACHEEAGIETGDSRRRAALEPLLRGTPLGAVWLIGPRMAPVGYLAAGFGWSLEAGGPVGFIGEFWIRPAIRGRGMGGQALDALLPELQKRGLAAVFAEVSEDGPHARALYLRRGFLAREGRRSLGRRL